MILRTFVRWLYKPTKRDEIQLNFINTNNELVFNENANPKMERKNQERVVLPKTASQGGLQYRRRWTERLTTNLEVYETDYTLKSTNSNILENQQFFQKTLFLNKRKVGDFL